MAVPTTTLAIRYAGNGSVTTAYPIPFPFLDASHIFAAVSSDGIEEPVLLSPSAYSVARLADGSGGALTTDTAVTAPAEILIFRSVPLTQPTVFQHAGPFPSKAAEQSYDRLLMQVQQLNRRINELAGVEDEDYVHVPSGDPSAPQGVEIWADAAARGSVKPKKKGQLGVETSTQTVWIAQSASAGDWKEFRPQYANKVVLGLVSDAGKPYRILKCCFDQW